MNNPPVQPEAHGMTTSLTLLDRIRESDQEAWKRFVHLYGPLIFRWCKQCGLSAEDSADVGQNVFTSVFGSIRNFQPRVGTGSFRKWLKTITHRKCVDYIRQIDIGHIGVGGGVSQSQLEQLPDEEDEDSEMREQERRELKERAAQLVLFRYKETSREAFIRVVFDGRKATDVAAELGMTANAVYLAITHIKSTIRKEFGGLLDDTE